MPRPLSSKVALVAGATRGAGRGIARALGEAGATVYCTGRSTRARLAGSRPETIDETAELVTAAGGHGIAVRVDHTVPHEVAALVARIEREQSRLDVLVNDVWGGDELTQFGTPFWELSLEQGRTMLERAVFSHIVTARHATPLLVASGGGLIVEITDGDNFQYRGNLFYDLVKTSVIRLAFAYARELRRKGVTAVAVTPGFLRSEAMLDRFGVTEATWRDAGQQDPNFLASETPLFVGRAIAALAADPEVHRKNGRVLASWTLSDEYDFTDADGARPHWGRHFEQAYGKDIVKSCDQGFYEYWQGGVMDTLFGEWP
jgi:NAD(P)-dependent dehydrogenase (short-subunit alcohol dehydrogenase family)